AKPETTLTRIRFLHKITQAGRAVLASARPTRRPTFPETFRQCSFVAKQKTLYPTSSRGRFARRCPAPHQAHEIVTNNFFLLYNHGRSTSGDSPEGVPAAASAARNGFGRRSSPLWFGRRDKRVN